MNEGYKEKPDTFARFLTTGLRAASIALATLPLQFTKSARMEIGERDNWTCQNCGQSFHKDHAMVHAAHYPAFHLRGHGDPDPDAGRVLCVRCHLKEHAEMFLQDNSEYNWHSLRLIARLAYTQGYHTWTYYAQYPEERKRDQDQVIQDLADRGLALGQFIPV